jgi:hypothetical protein
LQVRYELDALNYVADIVSKGKVEGVKAYLGKSAEPVYRGSVLSELQRKAARAPRSNKLSQGIEKVLRSDENATWKEVLRALEDCDVVERTTDDTVKWRRDDGRPASIRISALKDRVSRARKKISSR